jgi:hypothetical protein
LRVQSSRGNEETDNNNDYTQTVHRQPQPECKRKEKKGSRSSPFT